MTNFDDIEVRVADGRRERLSSKQIRWTATTTMSSTQTVLGWNRSSGRSGSPTPPRETQGCCDEDRMV